MRHQLEELEHFVEERVPFYLKRYWRWPAIAVAAIVVPVALGLWAFRFVAPYVPEYRAEAEAFGTRALGWPVKIERMYLGWHWFGPEVVMEDVRVLAPDESRALIRADTVRVGVAPGDFLRGGAFRPARVVFERPRIAFEVTPDGKVLLAGEQVGDLTAPAQDWRPLLKQLLTHGRFEVQDGDFTWNDRRGDLGKLRLTPVDLALESDGDDHALEASLALPESIGSSFAIELEAEGDPGAPESWRWQGGVDAEALQVGWLQSRLRPGALYAAAGVVDLEASVAADGLAFESLAGRLHARELLLAPKGRRTEFKSDGSGVDALDGEFDWRRVDAGWKLRVEQLAVRRGKRSWKASALHLDFNPGPPAATLQGDAAFVRLEDLALMASWLPKEVFPYTAELLDYAPNGDVRELAFHLALKDGSLADWGLRARVDGLGLRRRGRLPGFDGVTGMIDARTGGGRMTLDARGLVADFGALFRGPLRTEVARAEFQWVRGAEGLTVRGQDIELANADGRVRARLELAVPPQGSPTIDLAGEVFDVDMGAKAPYLPVGVMKPALVEWLDKAVVAGRVPRADFVLRGPLASFPFRDGQGLFEVRFQAHDGVLAYANDWPRVENVHGTVIFRNQGVEVRDARGSAAGMPFDSASAALADYRNAVVRVASRTRAPAERVTGFVRASPLSARFGAMLDEVELRGPVTVQAAIDIPVTATDATAVDVRATLRGVRADVAGLPFTARKLAGELRFTQDSARAEAVRGELLGAPLRATVATDPDGTTRIGLEARVGAGPLARALKLPLERLLAGAAPVRGEIAIPPHRAPAPLAVELHSALVGLAVDLPAPLGKPEVAPLAVAARLEFPSRDELEVAVRWGEGATADYRFVRRDRRWTLAGDDAAHVEIAAPLVDVGAWLERGGATPEPAGQPLALPFRTLRLRADRLDAGGQRFADATLELERFADAWSARIGAPGAEGTLRIPDDRNAFPVEIDMERLWLTPAPKAVDPEAAPAAEPPSALDPRELPAVTLRVSSLRAAGADLGGVDATIEKRPWGLALTALRAEGAGFALDATGRWEADNGRRHTRLEAKLVSTDVRRALSALGFAAAVEAGSAELVAAVDWPGGPFDDPLGRLAGTVKLSLGAGQLLDVKPGGASRALGLFSLAALPRRLTLDFRDVLRQGLAFDSVKGDFLIDQGNAYTTNLRLESANLEMNLVGRTGLAARDYDQLATVDTSLGATLPVAGALAGGPAVAAAALVVSRLFKRTLADATRVHYRISGPWDEPRIERAAPEEAKR